MVPTVWIKLCKILSNQGIAAAAKAVEIGMAAAYVPVIVLMLLEIVESLLDKQKSKKLEELAANLKKLRAGPHLAADEIARLEAIPIDDLPEGDLRLIYLVLHRFLRREFDAIGASQDELTAAIGRLDAEQKQRWNTVLIREFPGLRKALALTRDDLDGLIREHNKLRQAIERQHGEILKELDALAVAPPLEFTLLVPSKATRFAYRAQRVPLFGRESEMAALRTFLAPCPPDAVDFRWWLWTGPGGAGKSRLAWELCLEAESQGWRVGFLADDAGFDDWHRWRVARKTLMVVDYCAKRPETVRKAILGLTNNTDHIGHPIRILLLERSADPQADAWWTQFDQFGSSSGSAQLREFAYWPGPAEEKPDELYRFARPLDPPGDDALWSIIAAVYAERQQSPPPPEEVLNALRKIDPQGRPLFALLAAETLREQGLDAIRRWDIPTLTGSILKHEFARWRQECKVADRPDEDFERHLNLLAYATIVGGQPFNAVDRLATLTPHIPGSCRAVKLDWWRRFLGYAADPDHDRLEPFTPDILGELFVLLRLDGTLHAANNPRTGPPRDTLDLWRIAWSQSPLATAVFLNRAARDFTDHPGLHELSGTLALEPDPSETKPSEDELFLSRFLIGFTRGQFLGNFREALAAFDRAIALRPDYPVSHNNRGVALSDLGDHAAAVMAYDRAIALRPDYPDAHNNRGVALGRQRHYAAAVAAFDRAIALRPDDPAAHNNRGVALSDLGDHAAAVKAFDRAIALHPDYPLTYNNRGIALSDLGDHAAAIEAFDRAIALRPDYPEAHNKRGITLGRQGNHAAAVEAFDRAIEHRPDYPVAHNNRGVALSDLGDHAAAVKAYDRAIELRPDYPEAHYNRGVALTQQGHYAVAVESYDRAIALRPDYPVAHHARTIVLDMLNGDRSE